MSAKARRPHLPLPDSLPLRAAILAALSATPVVQAATVPPGGALDASQFLVNSFTTGFQNFPAVARDAAGDFVVVWYGAPLVNTYYLGVYAQRYNAAGQPQGNPITAGGVEPGSLASVSVAMDAAGDFVVAWSGYTASSAGANVYARQYTSSGSPVQSSPVQIDTFTYPRAQHASVAMDAAGDFVVTWQSYDQAASNSAADIYAREFNAAGTALQTSEFLVNTITSGAQLSPVVAMDSGGDFVIAWENGRRGTTLYYGEAIYARQYNASGTALQGIEFLVNTFSSSGQKMPTVAMDAAGDFVVAWESNDQATTNSGYDVYARQFNANGTAVQANEFLVNTVTTSGQGAPSVAMDAAGDFVVAWNGEYITTYHLDHIYAREYNAAGTALQTSQFMVNSPNTANQTTVAVAMDAAGDFITAWGSYDEAAYNSASDIYARRFEGPESVNLAATLTSSTSSALAGGSFTVTASVSNNTTITTTYGNVDIDTALGDASGIIVSFPLPAGIVPVAVSGNGWSCSTQSSTSLICDYGATLAASTAAANLTITFTGNAIGTLPLQAAVISDEQAIVNVNDLNPTLTLIDVKPTANAGSVSTAGAAVSGTLSATAGYHGQVLSFAIASQPVHGSVTLTNAAKGRFSYTPVAGYTGTDSFTFTAGDGTLNSNAAKETITVTAAGSGGGSSSGGGGAFGLFSLALLGLPLRRRMRRAASRR